MTYYHGGKAFTGKKIAPIINKLLERDEIEGYIEPFCGMLGVYRRINILPKKKYYASDVNKSLILMWKRKKKFDPNMTISKEEYKKIKESKSSALKGLVGFAFSYRGIYFGSYDQKKRPIDIPNQVNNVNEIKKRLKQVQFKQGDYKMYKPNEIKNMIIYCDPPYKDTTCTFYEETGKKCDKFNHDEFYDWCREMSRNNIVLVSEYQAPSDFKCIWENTFKYRLAKKGIERLYLV